jgi:hypothetical protein
MKTYIIYNEKGEEIGLIKASSHNKAEEKAKKKHGEKCSVTYTEV